MVPTPQVCVSTLVTVSTMAVVDLYLLEQGMLGNHGGGGGGGGGGVPPSSPGPGAWQCAAVLLGDLGFLLALRFVVAGVAAEARSPRRGFASALWFLFLSLLQLKLFFVCQNYRQERRAPDPLARKTLTLLLSVCLPSLFLVLTGAEHMAPPPRRQEVRGRLLWVVLDLLDVLDLQAGLWEAQGGGGGGGGGGAAPGLISLPLWAEGVVFFYGYALLLLLPCVALAELGGAGGGGGGGGVPPGQRGVGGAGAGAGGASPAPRKEALYPWLSLVTVNVLTLALRAAGVLWYRDPRVSTVFLGKNLLALAVKLSAAWERRGRAAAAGGAGPRSGGGAETEARRGDATLSATNLARREEGGRDGDGYDGDSDDDGGARGRGVSSLPPSRLHTLSRSYGHAHSLSLVGLERADAALDASFVTHEL